MAGVKRQRSYTVAEKLAAIDRVHNGETQAKISRDLGIAESTLRGWIKNETKLRSFVQNVDSEVSLERKRVRYSAKPDVDKALSTWFVQERAKGTPLSGPILQAQATKFGTLMGDETYQASKGFISRFKTRHGISQVSISGESQSANETAANEFPAKLKTIIETENYNEEQMYNCDETALFAKLFPDKTLALKYETQKTAGFKKIKDRVPLLFCTNKTGSHKLTPLLIGRFNNPRCFKHLNKAKLPVIYSSSKNAWMTRSIFEEWFHNSFVPAVRKHLRKKKLEPKALLLLDNCPAHPPSELLVSNDGQIRVLYLPFNTTSKIQPLDQGIIQNFKTNYRGDLVSEMISCESSSVSDFLKELNIKEIIYLVKKAWDGVKQKSIENCWMKALGPAFSVNSCASENPNDTDSEPEFKGFTEEDILLTKTQTKEDKGKFIFQLIKDFNLNTSPEIINEWLELNENGSTTEDLTEEEIITGCETGSDCESDEERLQEKGVDDNDENYVEKAKISHSEALNAAETLAQYMEEQDAETIQILQLRGMIDFVKKKKAKAGKQQKITSYFIKPPSQQDEPADYINFI
uniref:HTH CENPB-type domain-containing protein n=1 Tax=Pelusios castaneus TaxID=367368 RepID=A0A8C8RVB4_9SAUR